MRSLARHTPRSGGRKGSRGADRNRTGVNGFAGRCVATPPRRRSRYRLASGVAHWYDVPMRRPIPVLLLAALALALLAPPAPAAAKRARCAVKGSHTVAKNRFVRAYVKRDGEGNRVLHGCWRASGRKLTVAHEYDDDYVTSGAYRDVRLAGRFIAIVFEATDVSCKADCPPDF